MAEYPVATIKSAVCGYGRAEKARWRGWCARMLALDADPRSEHEADALAAAICHTQRARDAAPEARA